MRGCFRAFFWLGYFNCLELKEHLIPKPVQAISIDFRGVWLTQRTNILKKKKKATLVWQRNEIFGLGITPQWDGWDVDVGMRTGLVLWVCP